MLYEMVAGRVPFAGETNSDLIVSILEREPTPLAGLSPPVPAELQRIISKSLRKDREERYQVIKDLLLDLKSLRQEMDFEAKLAQSVLPELGGEARAKGSEGQTAVENTRRQPLKRTRSKRHARHQAPSM